MDVNIVSGPTPPSGPGSPVPARHADTTRAAAEAAATQAAPPGAADSPGEFVRYLKGMTRSWQHEPKIHPEGVPARKAPVVPKEGGETSPEPVKFDIATDDVLARFWIDEASKRVVITMYVRSTGEIIRQTPPREVQDTVAALEGRGLVIDTAN